jgi:hypothetical protein
MGASILEDSGGSVFSIEGTFCSEHESRMFVYNVDTFLPDCIALVSNSQSASLYYEAYGDICK